MSTNEKPTVAFTLSLIAGILILAGSGVSLIWLSVGMPFWRWMGGMMGGWSMMGWGFFFGMGIFGIVSGIIVLIGALMLNKEPKQASTWGTLILVFSILSFFGMGGFFLGAILGIIGGILAITWKPSTTT